MRTLPILAAALLATTAHADWTNIGGNAARNGRSSGVGPSAATLAWGVGPSSIIAWHPCVVGDRVYVVRQTSFVPNGVPDDARVYCLDIEDGSVEWDAIIPYEAGDWTPNVYGVANGRVFCGRGGNGSSVSAPVYCLDATDGSVIWDSEEDVATGSYDGVVFAPDGDPIFATHTYVRRVDWATGDTVWSTPRSCSVSGDCGPAITGDAVFVDEVAPGGQVITKIDLATGAVLYSSPVMDGFLSQNTPFCGDDGSVYYARTQGNPATDFLFAFTDTGTALVERWNRPCLAGAGAEHAIGPDGSIYMLGRTEVIERRDAATGALLDETAMIVTADGGAQSHFAIDANGDVYYGNGGFPGTVFAFTADLAFRWSVVVPNLNQGGPSLGPDGTLVVCGNGTVVRAYRDACAEDPDVDGSGAVDFNDVLLVLSNWGGAGPIGDVDCSGAVDFADLLLVLANWS